MSELTLDELKEHCLRIIDQSNKIVLILINEHENKAKIETEIRADEREKMIDSIVAKLKSKKDVIWQDTDSESRTVRANAWDKIEILNEAIEIIQNGGAE